jgi:hypothetical protein
MEKRILQAFDMTLHREDGLISMKPYTGQQGIEDGNKHPYLEENSNS